MAARDSLAGMFFRVWTFAGSRGRAGFAFPARARSAVLAALLLCGLAAPAHAQMSDREDGRSWRDRLGDLFPAPRAQSPDEDEDAPRAAPRRRFGEEPFAAPRRQATPERGDPRGPNLRGGETAPKRPAPKPALTRAQQLDALYERLARSKDEAEAHGLTMRIERIQARSGSPTADLLMSRAAIALVREQPILAEDLLDRIVDLEPGWADAWMRRGAMRARRDDISGAIADFGQALQREPRHLGALTGLGFLMLKLDRKDEALRVLRRALAVNPHAEPTGKVVKKLAGEQDGQAL